MTCKIKQNIEFSTAYIRNSAIDIPESTYSIPVGPSPLTYAEKTGNVSMERRFSEYLFAVMKRISQVPDRYRTTGCSHELRMRRKQQGVSSLCLYDRPRVNRLARYFRAVSKGSVGKFDQLAKIHALSVVVRRRPTQGIPNCVTFSDETRC